jgi:hypothetical protein
VGIGDDARPRLPFEADADLGFAEFLDEVAQRAAAEVAPGCRVV